MDYIRHQFEHHNNVTLEDEIIKIIKIMKKYDIDYDPQYIIRAPDQ